MSDIQISTVPLEDVWRMRREVMYPTESVEFVRLDNDTIGIHLGLFEAGKLISVVSLFPHGDKLQFRKFATLDEKQGQGYGSRLLRHIMDWGLQNGYRYIWCNARAEATGFYERFGMIATGESWIKWNIEFIKMEKFLIHADHSRN